MHLPDLVPSANDIPDATRQTPVVADYHPVVKLGRRRAVPAVGAYADRAHHWPAGNTLRCIVGQPLAASDTLTARSPNRPTHGVPERSGEQPPGGVTVLAPVAEACLGGPALWPC